MSKDQQNSWETDPVWNLLDEAHAPKASPAFAQNVLREVRQLEAEPVVPWWKKFFAPVPLTAGALAATAAITLLAIIPDSPMSDDSSRLAFDSSSSPVISELDDAVNQQLLIAAAEDPELFSDAELVAMLY